MLFATFLSGADLVAHLFDGGEGGLKVQELTFTWCDGLLFPDLADVAGSVAYTMDCNRAYEKEDVGWRAGMNREGQDQGLNVCFYRCAAHTHRINERELQLKAQEIKTRIAPLATEIAHAFGKTTKFADMNVSADTEVMLAFVHDGCDLLVFHSSGNKLWFVSKQGNQKLCAVYNGADSHNGHFVKLVEVRTMRKLSHL